MIWLSRRMLFPSSFDYNISNKHQTPGEMLPPTKAAGFKGTLRLLLMIFQDARTQSTTT
jgi:hypothetical protein